MFELHVVVAAVIMLNILELIMEIVPNYPTYTQGISWSLAYLPSSTSSALKEAGTERSPRTAVHAARWSSSAYLSSLATNKKGDHSSRRQSQHAVLPCSWV
jgi:hypothetical protein